MRKLIVAVARYTHWQLTELLNLTLDELLAYDDAIGALSNGTN